MPMYPQCPSQPEPAGSTPHRRIGFTLIELLTAVAIIAILSVLLLPSIAEMRARAQTAACASNLRQIGAMITTHASEYNGAYPISHSDGTTGDPVIWYRNFEDQVGGQLRTLQQIDALLPSLHCGADPYSHSGNIYTDYGSYGMNARAFGDNAHGKENGVPVKTNTPSMASGRKLSDLVLISEGKHRAQKSDSRSALLRPTYSTGDTFAITPRHGSQQDSANVLFADLHVRNLSSEEIEEINSRRESWEWQP